MTLRMALISLILPALGAGAAVAQPGPAASPGSVSVPSGPEATGSTTSGGVGALPPPDELTAREAVRQGNQLLKKGEAPQALEYYDRAGELEPDAPQVPFVKGLGYYAEGDYEDARQQFETAAAGSDADVALDALYSLGTTYHAEALAPQVDPKAAVEKLEEAMRRYRAVLKDRPDFEPARDADRKAAQLRRMIREQLLEQPQQQQQNSDSQESESQEQQQQQSAQSDQSQEKKQKEQEQEQGQSSEQEEQSEQQQQSQPQDSQEQSESQQQSASREEQQEEPSPESQQQSEESSAQQDMPRESQAAKATEQEKSEQATREQAERRLREMMQAQRERQERRRQPPSQVPISPVEKDW
ncbi:MAG: hypothetical protein J5J06_16565 [Phycisphaerae bacterium]|nr:hypothetical protein [Phycisphaerae bacterium]